MKKVLVISDMIGGPGGVYNYFENLENELSKKFNFVFLLNDSTEGYVSESYDLGKVLFKKISHHMNDRDVIESELLDTINKEDPDIVHIVNGSIRSNLLIREFLFKQGIDFITTEQLIDKTTDIEGDRLSRVKDVNKKTNHVIYVSESNKDIAENFFGVNCDSSSVIYNSIKPIKSKKTYFRETPYKFFTTARCVTQKGIDVTIKALSHITDTRVCFHVFGDGELKEKYEKQANDIIGNRHDFKILGWKDIDYEKIVNNYDLFISSSRAEGLSFSIIESASAGIPMICSDTSGSVELIEKSSNGYLYGVESDLELATLLKGFIQDPSTLNSKATSSIKKIDKLFGNKDNFAKLCDIYNKF